MVVVVSVISKKKAFRAALEPFTLKVPNCIPRKTSVKTRPTRANALTRTMRLTFIHFFIVRIVSCSEALWYT